MKQAPQVIVFALGACLVVAFLLLRRPPAATGPRLRLLGLTNESSGAATVALFCLSNPMGHRIVLNGSRVGAPDHTREVSSPGGWQTVDAPSPSGHGDFWDLMPGTTCIFAVPVVTNQVESWRVRVRYLDGGGFLKVRLLPWVRLPWKGSGEYRDVASDPLTLH